MPHAIQEALRPQERIVFFSGRPTPSRSFARGCVGAMVIWLSSFFPWAKLSRFSGGCVLGIS